jgi:hypothetical protein
MGVPSKSAKKAVITVTPTVKFDILEKERQPSALQPSTKPCARYVDGLLGAKNKNGSPYKSD